MFAQGFSSVSRTRAKNVSFNVQMFHLLSWGSVVCWILCFSPPHPVILRSPYRGAVLPRLTFEPLPSYCRTGAEDSGQSEGQNRSVPLKSGALAADQLVWWEKVPLKCSGAEDVSLLRLTFRVKDVRKRQGCEKWGVNNITALNITIIHLYSRAEGPLGGRARLGNLQRVT